MVNQDNGRFYSIKSYEADLFGWPGVVCENGSLNSKQGGIRIYPFEDVTARDRFYNSKMKEKLRRGYRTGQMDENGSL